MKTAKLIMIGVLLSAASLLRADTTDSRFTTVGNTVVDAVTGLTWLLPGTVGVHPTVTYSQAGAVCTSPWRLPTVEELSTLLDPRSSVAPLCDSHFTNMDYIFWTSTPYSNPSQNQWAISFDDGNISGDGDGAQARVICVQ